MKRLHPERGSAIIMIFIAVALFGMLAYAFMKGSSGSTKMMTDEQAKVYAQQIIATGENYKLAIKRLDLRGCLPSSGFTTKVSFENSLTGGYSNTAAPADKSCHLFSSNGGQMVLRSSKINDQENFWHFTHSNRVYGTISPNYSYFCAGADMTAFISFKSLSICNQINKQVNYGAGEIGPPPEATSLYVWEKYFGSCRNSYLALLPLTNTQNKLRGCFKINNNESGASLTDTYMYFQILKPYDTP